MVPDFLTIAEAGALIGKRELSPVELTESRLARIERLDGKLHSFIRVLREPALAGSPGSCPAIACSMIAQSSAVHAIGPAWSSE